MKIQEAARLTGMTVRTLQYYDQIGLLKPHYKTDAGYRIYSDEELMKLQQILFFRELDFPLRDIKAIMENENYDRQGTLLRHKQLLIKKKERLERLIALVDETIEGEGQMSFKEFDMEEIERCKKEYAKEVKERYGKQDAYKESVEKTEKYSKEDWERAANESEEIFRAFAKLAGSSPDSKEAKVLVKRWQDYITKTYYTCTDEILAGLGQMYVSDERFKNNLDRYGDGTALFMSQAIDCYIKLCLEKNSDKKVNNGLTDLSF